ncbi:hypothetical protein GCM10027293_31300 [Pontibacter aydingkolensis]
MVDQHHLILQLNPTMIKERYRELLQVMLQSNYQMGAAFNVVGKCVALSGYWVSAKLYSGKYLEVDNFVVDEAYHNAGIGKLLSGWMQRETLRLKCEPSYWMLILRTALRSASISGRVFISRATIFLKA